MSKKHFVKVIMGRWGVNCGLLLIFLISAGCGTLGREDASPGAAGGTNNPAAFVSDPTAATDKLRIGDGLRVDFSGLSVLIPSHEEQIKDDGTITLPLIGMVQAAGKTAAELQREIWSLYVPKYYVKLTVVVRTAERFYYVGGEVKMPNRQAYVGGVTVLKAIQSAGDFTDFANKKRVRLMRVNGKIEIIDCNKARKNPKLDLPIYPGDTIHVDRSAF